MTGELISRLPKGSYSLYFAVTPLMPSTEHGRSREVATEDDMDPQT